MRLFIDCETLPDMRSGALDAIRASIRPPRQYTRPESIAAWLADHGEAEVQRKWRAQALDPLRGELAAVGFAADDGEPHCLVRDENESERDFLAIAMAAISEMNESDTVIAPNGQTWPAPAPYLIAHRAAFDLGFLARRSWILGVPPLFPLPFNGRHPHHFGCSMTAWTGGGPGEFIGLDALCRALGIASPKAAGDGSAVLDWWLAGERDRIAEYCRGDVRAVRAVWHRLHWEHAA